MICYVCDKDNFHSMGAINPARELLVCKDCGNVCYKVEPGEEARMKEYYAKEYRPEPTVANLITTNNKLQYIRLFLDEWLKENDGQKRRVADIGCATGYIPAFFRNIGHIATGCEYTVTFRRFAEHFYQIPIPTPEGLPNKKPYDLMIFYHTLEHMIEPDKKLAHYAAMLADDGRMLVSCPEWFDIVEEASGTDITSFEHHFHKDHINVFSAQSMKNLFRKAGLEIVKEDHLQYGQSYMLKKGAVQDIVREPWEGQVEKIKKAKQAIDLYRQGKAQDAIAVWPKFPEAWIHVLYQVHTKDPKAAQEHIAKGEQVIKDNARWRGAVANWLYQLKEFPKALSNFQWLLAKKPNAQAAMFAGLCLVEMGKPDVAFHYFDQVRVMNPLMWKEASEFMCKAAVMQPTWDERALQQIMAQAAQGAKPEFVDPALEPQEAQVPAPEA